MRDIEFQQQVLGIESPWRVVSVDVDRATKVVETRIVHDGPTSCPMCKKHAPIHDHRERRWRHLDLYEFRSYAVARVPRVSCDEHGVHQLDVQWAVSLLGETTILGVAQALRLSWSEVDTIMRRAVERGKSRRGERVVRRIGIDEKPGKKRHVYFTIVSDLDTSEVIWIGRGRMRESLDVFWHGLSKEEREQIEGVAMDMHEPYIQSTLSNLPGAAEKIVFDKFHITMYRTRAVDLTRRIIMREGGHATSGLKRTRHLWLFNERNLDDEKREQRLRMKSIRLGVAWTNKEHFTEFWRSSTRQAAQAFFDDWYESVRITFNQPMLDAANTLRRHSNNMLTYVSMPITNAASESIKSRIQLVKFRARGYRNASRFERAIMFYCGGLDMSPAT